MFKEAFFPITQLQRSSLDLSRAFRFMAFGGRYNSRLVNQLRQKAEWASYWSSLLGDTPCRLIFHLPLQMDHISGMIKGTERCRAAIWSISLVENFIVRFPHDYIYVHASQGSHAEKTARDYFITEVPISRGDCWVTKPVATCLVWRGAPMSYDYYKMGA